MKNKELTFKLGSTLLFGTQLLSLRSMDLCSDGVRGVFPGLPSDTTKVTFVFSQRPHSEAAAITFGIHKDDYEWLNGEGILDDFDYNLELDGEETFLMAHADATIRKLWNEGYNYIRAEYSA